MDWSQFRKHMANLDELQPYIAIRHETSGLSGMAIRLGENLSKMWQSGNILVFWDNGDHGICRDDDIITILEEK